MEPSTEIWNAVQPGAYRSKGESFPTYTPEWEFVIVETMFEPSIIDVKPGGRSITIEPQPLVEVVVEFIAKIKSPVEPAKTAPKGAYVSP